MINNEISNIILSRLNEKSRVVDIGGGRYPWFRANYIIDRRTYEQKVGITAFAGNQENKEYFSKNNWICRDFFDLPWPFENNFFDFSICMGTLEDIRDPIIICKEIQRISKAGYISTPTRAAESFIGCSQHPLSNKLYGYIHHRWFVEIKDFGLIFKMKTPLIYQHKKWLIKRVGQHTLNYFWDDSFNVTEHYLVGHDDAYDDIVSFYNDHEQWLNQMDNDKYNWTSRYNHWPEKWGNCPDFSKTDNFVLSKPDNIMGRVLRRFGL